MNRVISCSPMIILLSLAVTASSAQGLSSEDIQGVLAPYPAGTSNRIAQSLEVPSGTVLEGIRFYNNDGLQGVDKVEILAGQLNESPVVLASGTPTAALSSAMIELTFDEPALVWDGPIFAVFYWPSGQVRTGVGPGTGAGIGYVAGDAENVTGWTSTDGSNWEALHPSIAVGVVPIASAGGPSGVSAGNPHSGHSDGIPVTKLLKVFPNPANPAVAVTFELAQPAAVEMQVHNARGQLVRRLVRPAVPAGTHEMVWQGKDSRGMQVATGVYHLQMTLGELTVTRRIVVVK